MPANPPTSRSFRARRRGALVRTVTGVWLAIQSLVAAIVPVADAGIEHANRIVAHWEDGADSTCPPQHDATACQLCQVHATLGRVPPSAPDVPWGAGAPATLIAASQIEELGPSRSDGPPPRAPPIR